LIDKDGLLSDKRKNLTESQRIFARPDMEDGLNLIEVIKKKSNRIFYWD